MWISQLAKDAIWMCYLYIRVTPWWNPTVNIATCEFPSPQKMPFECVTLMKCNLRCFLMKPTSKHCLKTPPSSMWNWKYKEIPINMSPRVTLVRTKILSISLAPCPHVKSPTPSDETRPRTVVARKSHSYLSAIKERGGGCQFWTSDADCLKAEGTSWSRTNSTCL